MVYLLIFDALFIVLLILFSFVGVINATRAGQVLIGSSLIHITLAVFSYFGWPVLRGDISSQFPLTRQDSIERQSDPDLSKQERPSRIFVFGLVGLGVFALVAGLLLILL